jgi:DNA-binding transcriptional regulator YdaS (Cro superfamily)
MVAAHVTCAQQVMLAFTKALLYHRLMDENAPLAIAIAAAGGIGAFTKHLEITPQAVSEWRKRGVPPARCIEVENLSSGKVTRYELRPDVFGAAPEQAA